MENRGYAMLYRDLLDKDFAYKPDYLTVWIHLLLRATYKKRKIIFNDKPLTLEIGDCIISQRKFSERLGISLTKVHRIINFFKKNGQVCTRATSKFTIISICNFESYQKCGTPAEHQRNTDETPAEHQRNTSENKQERKKGRKEEQKIYTSKTSDVRESRTTKKTLAEARLQKFNIFWDTFADKRGREGALKSWHKLGNIDDVLFSKILQGADRYAQERPALKQKGLTPKMAQGWITEKRWEDEAEPSPQQTTTGLSLENQQRVQWEETRRQQERLEDQKAIAESKAREKKINSFSPERLQKLDAFIDSKKNRYLKSGTVLGRNAYLKEFLEEEINGNY